MSMTQEIKILNSEGFSIMVEVDYYVVWNFYLFCLLLCYIFSSEVISYYIFNPFLVITIESKLHTHIYMAFIYKL